MKKILSFVFLFAFLASSCGEEELVKNQSTSSDSLKFTAVFEGDESRTYVEKDRLLRWTAGDQISLFVANTLNRQYQFEGKTGANSGYFNEVNHRFGTGNDLDCHYAVYPYDSTIEITDDTDESIQITATLPAEQSYAENSFGLGANTMVAVTQDTDDTYLKFKNVCGYLKLQFYGDDVTIKSITLKGNNNEMIAGKATITSVYGGNPSVSMTADATGTITLDCGNKGVKIGTTEETATAFWMVVPPVTFRRGFTITITDVNGKQYTKPTTNLVTLERNVIHPMKAFAVEMEGIPNNQIWYTSSDSKIVTPYATNVFGANIVSNVFENGHGIITFDNDVTSIGQNAFSGCSSLIGITIPNSVTSIAKLAFLHCSSLVGITIPSNVTKIGDSAFCGCSSLNSITIPDNVTSVDFGAFADCSSLVSIVVDSNNPVYDSRENCNAVIEIASNTLVAGCKTTVIPNSVTSIGDFAFDSCTSLTGITIPNSVTYIGYGAFAWCSGLISITIPSSVTSIHHSSFFDCYSLTRVDVQATTPPTLNGDNFINCSSDLKIYVPSESLEAYKTADYWKDLNLFSDN